MATKLTLTLTVLGTLLSVALSQAPVSSVNSVNSVNPNQVCLMVPPSTEECYRGYADKPITDKTSQVACLQELLWNYEEQQNNTEDFLAYFRGTFGPLPTVVDYDPSTALPPSGYRKRRAYRTLSDGERTRFHNAMDKLYEEGTIRKFGLLLQQSTGHLNGASFLPWNRVFMTMFEEALRKVDRHVFLPYLDTTMDDAMDNPVNSDLWTSKYLGTGTGRVVDGLGAGYVTHQGHLERNYGTGSRLFSKQFIRDLLSKCSLKDISTPTAKEKYDIEIMHGGPHFWFGDDMAYALTAAFDPLFYLHMAYTDYVYELFRINLKRSCKKNPSLDYPDVEIGSSHHPESPIKGFDWLKNRDGIQNYWIDNWYQYETHPVCPDCCPTCKSPKPMYCDTKKKVCVARSRRTNFSDRELFYEPHELAALSSTRPLRNRGTPFHHLRSDGRTLSSAYDDAVKARSTTQRETRRSRISGGRRQRLRDKSLVDTSSSQTTREATRGSAAGETGPIKLLGPIPGESSLMVDSVGSGGSPVRGEASRADPTVGDMMRGDGTMKRVGSVRETPLGSGGLMRDLQRGVPMQESDPTLRGGRRRRPGHTRARDPLRDSVRSDRMRSSSVSGRQVGDMEPIRMHSSGSFGPQRGSMGLDSMRSSRSFELQGGAVEHDRMRPGASVGRQTDVMVLGDMQSSGPFIRAGDRMGLDIPSVRSSGSFDDRQGSAMRSDFMQSSGPVMRQEGVMRPGSMQSSDPVRRQGGAMRSDLMQSSGPVMRQGGAMRSDLMQSSGPIMRQVGVMRPDSLQSSGPVRRQEGAMRSGRMRSSGPIRQTGAMRHARMHPSGPISTRNIGGMNIDFRRFSGRRGDGFRSDRMRSMGPVRRQGSFVGRRRPSRRGTVHRPDVAQTGSSSVMRVMRPMPSHAFGPRHLGGDPFLREPYPPMMFPQFPM